MYTVALVAVSTGNIACVPSATNGLTNTRGNCALLRGGPMLHITLITILALFFSALPAAHSIAWGPVRARSLRQQKHHLLRWIKQNPVEIKLSSAGCDPRHRRAHTFTENKAGRKQELTIVLEQQGVTAAHGTVALHCMHWGLQSIYEYVRFYKCGTSVLSTYDMKSDSSCSTYVLGAQSLWDRFIEEKKTHMVKSSKPSMNCKSLWIKASAKCINGKDRLSPNGDCYIEITCNSLTFVLVKNKLVKYSFICKLYTLLVHITKYLYFTWAVRSLYALGSKPIRQK